MPEYRLNIEVAGLGSHKDAEHNMELFADAFERLYPEAGAVLAANHRLETIDVTFTIEAEDAKEATETGIDTFCTAAADTPIEPQPIVDIRASLIPASTHDDSLTGELATV